MPAARRLGHVRRGYSIPAVPPHGRRPLGPFPALGRAARGPAKLEYAVAGPLRGPCAARRRPPGPALPCRYKNFHFILNYILLLLTSYYYYYIFH